LRPNACNYAGELLLEASQCLNSRD